MDEQLIKDFKTYFDESVYSQLDKNIINIQKPADKCGSTTCIAKYILNRFKYEENYNILVVVKQLELKKFYNIFNIFKNLGLSLSEENNSITNDMNNKISILFQSPDLSQNKWETETTQYDDLFILDEIERGEDYLLDDSHFSIIFDSLKSNSKIITEYAYV